MLDIIRPHTPNKFHESIIPILWCTHYHLSCIVASCHTMTIPVYMALSHLSPLPLIHIQGHHIVGVCTYNSFRTYTTLGHNTCSSNPELSVHQMIPNYHALQLSPPHCYLRIQIL